MLISPKYEVLAEIGRGGMGIVYKVRHTTLDTVYALKILPSHLADDEALVARFHREARVMAQLRHPHIVRVIDVDKAGDLHYFVMEYVDGRSLSKIIATEGARALGSVVEVAIQVAQGLAYAHGRRPAVIHRDIKPANILVEGESGRAVVTDFGLAKLAGGSDSIRTESGQFIGTLRYCAPEQFQGSREVDARVDVYALGMVIYEMYAGRSAYVDFERPQVVAGLLQLSVEHPFTFTPETPEAFRSLVRRATAKDPARRYATVADLLADLERLRRTVGAVDDQDVTAPFETAPRSPRRRVIAVSTTLVLGLSLGAGLLAREPLRQLVGRGAARDAATEPVVERGALAEKPAARIRRFVSVMDFTSGSPDPQLAWMRDAIRDNLNSRLSLSPECKVFSKEFIDFKAQQMVRQGHYQDVKAAAMEVAQNLGVTKAVIGSFRASDETLHIEAHLVDMETGVQEASETVEGRRDDFVELQASLAAKLMTRLGVSAPEAVPQAVQAAETGANLENYRLLLEAEGQTSVRRPEPVPTAVRKDKGRRGEVPGPRPLHDVARLLEDLTSAWEARAADGDGEMLAAEDEIRALLEEYRRACERKDLGKLAAVYDELSPAQIDANRRYFENARDLTVAFEEIDVAVADDEAVVSYTRRDRFVDGETERPTKVDVRLTKALVRVDGFWRLVSGGTRP